MAWKILTIIWIATVYAETKWHHLHKREMKSSICDQIQNNTNKVHCYCGSISRTPSQIINADCYQTVNNISQDDPSWDGFDVLQNVSKLTLTNTRGIAMNYIPTNALKHTKTVLRLDVKYCNIDKIEPFAFANLSRVKDITLRDNQVRVLAPNAFAHHPSLKVLSLDQNNIAEINRDVFVDLPSLEQLFFTGNKITTIHDRAFIHLTILRELEIDKNSIFSLNSETFAGLINLQKLELSSNNLEVIGDNTFVPLVNLRYLNLADNKIQMLDEGAFNGLINLESLSLPRNKLSAIDNEKVFGPLKKLNMLSLQDNEIRVIKPEAIAPLLNRFKTTSSQLFLKGNRLNCDCSLDVFRPVINKTQNRQLNEEIDNLQCYPSDEVKLKWDKLAESEKSSTPAQSPVVEVEELPDNGAYEYYDESELNGTLFYFDMRKVLNCTEPKDAHPLNSIVSTTPVVETERSNKVSNKGTLDLSAPESTTAGSSVTVENKILQENPTGSDERVKYRKDNAYTTSRLATVSAKPVDQKGFDDHDMASDEAKPDRIKAHRSVQEQKDIKPENKHNNAHTYFAPVPTLIMIICFRILL